LIAGIRFVAYNALAAGLLTGKHQPPKKDQPLDGRAAEAASGSAREVAAGRFKNNPNYLPRFTPTPTSTQLRWYVYVYERSGRMKEDGS